MAELDIVTGPDRFVPVKDLHPRVHGGTAQFDDPGVFSLGVSTGYHQSLANWGTAKRLLGFAGPRQLLTDSEWERIVGVRDMPKPSGGVTRGEAEELARVYDREQIFSRVNDGSVSMTGAFLLGNLVGSFLDPINVGSMVATMGASAMLNAAGGIVRGAQTANSLGKRMGKIQQARRFTMRHKALMATAGATAEATASLPMDIAIAEAQEQRPYTSTDAFITLAASAALGGVVGNVARVLENKNTKQVRRLIKDDIQDIPRDELHMLAEFYVDNAVPDPFDKFVSAYKKIRDGGYDLEAPGMVDDVFAKLKADQKYIRDQEAVGARTKKQADDVDVEPDFQVKDTAKFDGLNSKFESKTDAAVYAAGKGDEDALDQLVTSMVERNIISADNTAAREAIAAEAKLFADDLDKTSNLRSTTPEDGVGDDVQAIVADSFAIERIDAALAETRTFDAPVVSPPEAFQAPAAMPDAPLPDAYIKSRADVETEFRNEVLLDTPEAQKSAELAFRTSDQVSNIILSCEGWRGKG